MVKAITLDETWDYIAECDRDGEDQTIWLLGTIDAVLLAQLEDDLLHFKVGAEEGDTETKLKMNEKNVEVVRHGLKGFTNFTDNGGAEVRYQKRSVTRAGRSVSVMEDATLRRIPAPIIRELAEQILAGNSLTEDEVKNSD